MNRIKFLREEKNMLQDDLAKIIKVSQKTISNYETEARDIPTEKVIELANFFGVSTDYLLGNSDIRNQKNNKIEFNTDSNVFPITDIPIKVPVIGKISAGLPILATENIEGYEFAPSSYIKEGFDYFYLKVEGDSMNLKFNNGDVVLVQKQDALENDEIGVILVDDEATVKKFKHENGMIILYPMSTNPEHTVQIYKEEQIKIVGKVISYQGKI